MKAEGKSRHKTTHYLLYVTDGNNKIISFVPPDRCNNKIICSSQSLRLKKNSSHKDHLHVEESRHLVFDDGLIVMRH